MVLFNETDRIGISKLAPQEVWLEGWKADFDWAMARVGERYCFCITIDYSDRYYD